MGIIRIAVQSKGRLYEDTMNLLKEADIQVKEAKRTLLVKSPNFPLEVLFLRDDDIPQSVSSGVADIGIVGENEFTFCVWVFPNATYRWPFPMPSTTMACNGSMGAKLQHLIPTSCATT